jgi:hypothetical protein
MAELILCKECGVSIQPLTAQRTGGLCRPCNGGYRHSTEESRRWNEEEKRYRESPVGNLRRSLAERAWKSPEAFGALTPDEQSFVATAFLSGEIRGDGFQQYFELITTDRWAATITCLQEIGADQSLRILIEAKDVLFGSGELTEALLKQFQAHPPLSLDGDTDSKLDELNSQFWEDRDGLDDRLDAFAESRLLN